MNLSPIESIANTLASTRTHADHVADRVARMDDVDTPTPVLADQLQRLGSSQLELHAIIDTLPATDPLRPGADQLPFGTQLVRQGQKLLGLSGQVRVAAREGMPPQAYTDADKEAIRSAVTGSTTLAENVSTAVREYHEYLQDRVMLIGRTLQD